jgi:D-arabinose 1-dehydrogenase-like Zn-dependent alcohol dehydrogenase
LAVQELCALGAEVTVQVPSSDLLEKLRGFKIKAVKVGSPIDVLNALEEDSVDAIIDTVGGRELWLACRRLFGLTGQVGL